MRKEIDFDFQVSNIQQHNHTIFRDLFDEQSFKWRTFDANLNSFKFPKLSTVEISLSFIHNEKWKVLNIIYRRMC